MQVSVETTTGLERRMTVELSVADIENEVNKRLQEMTRTTRLQGFRPGKVPLNVLRSRFYEQVRGDIIDELIRKTFPEAIRQENLNPAGTPSIDTVNDNKENNTFSYTAMFEVYPKVSINSLQDSHFEEPDIDINESDIDSTIEKIRKQHAQWQKVDRPARENDQVIIDFVGTINGEPFKGNEGSNVPLELGSKRMIEGFEDGLINAKEGETVILDLTFPDDYHSADYAGKAVQFSITIHAVNENVLPDLDEAFFTQLGIKGDNVDFRAEVKKNMQRELEDKIRQYMKKQVMDSILATNTIDVPKALIEEESKVLAQNFEKQYARYGMEPQKMDASLFEGEAKRRVSLGLLLSKIVEENNLELTDDELRTGIENLAQSYEDPNEVISWYYGDAKRLDDIKPVIIENKIVEWGLKQGQCETKSYTVSEFLEKGEAKQDEPTD